MKNKTCNKHINRHVIYSIGNNVSVKGGLYCDLLPADVWRECKDHLLCLKCSKRYSDWRSLRKHMNFFCQVEPLFPCPYCPHRARISTLLKYHIVREHTAYVSTDKICWPRKKKRKRKKKKQRYKRTNRNFYPIER